MYSFDSRVRYSETDANLTMTPAAVLNYFQDCSTFHSEDVGHGCLALREMNRGWVVNYWRVRINRLPKLGEEIRIGTEPYFYKGCIGYRYFNMTTLEGECVAEANSVWTLLDLTGKPVRITDEVVCHYELGPEPELTLAGRKIAVPESENYEIHAEIPVTEQYIDSNLHVNNEEYLRMAMKLVPQEFTIREIHIEYRKSAVLHDVIVPKCLQIDDTMTIVLQDCEGNPYAIVQFMI